jgi:hypothetical protein
MRICPTSHASGGRYPRESVIAPAHGKSGHDSTTETDIREDAVSASA